MALLRDLKVSHFKQTARNIGYLQTTDPT